MSTLVLVVHLMICIALIVVVLLQRSEGGALGIGGGGSAKMSGRRPGDGLTRLTTVLAAIFFGTSILLTILAGQPGVGGGGSILDQIDRGAPAAPASGGTGGGILDQIQPPGAPSAPAE
ncbi:MAG: preprotein translocase subunit SecG [Pseudomonadota bacterium]